MKKSRTFAFIITHAVKLLKRLFFLLPALMAGSVFAQSTSAITFDSYSSEIFSYHRGLSQNTVQCIMQDSRGFVWIGTWDGLNRFDGYSFQIYKPDYNKPKGKISNETVNTIVEDKNGSLWIGTDKGLNAYNFLTDSFATYNFSFYNQNSIASDSISSLCFDRSGVLWIGTDKGLCSFDASRNKFSTYNSSKINKATIPSDRINKLFIDSRNTLWIATSSGAAVMDLNTRKIQRIADNSTDSNDCIQITSMAEFGGRMWLGTSCGLKIFDLLSFSEIPLPSDEANFYNSRITCMLLDNNNNLWVGTVTDGLYIYNVSENSVQHIYSDYESRYGLSNNAVLSLMKTGSGEIWVGTIHGLNKYSSYTYKFPHYRLVSKPFSYSHNLVWAFHIRQNGNLLVGTEAGLLEFNLESHAFANFASSTFGNIPVRSLYIDNNDNVWVGTFQKGLYQLSPDGRILQHFSDIELEGLPDLTIWKIVPQGEKYLWLATYGGVSRLDLATGKTDNWISPGYESPTQISNNKVNHLFIDRTGIVWISTFNGLNRLDPQSGKVFVFRNDKGNPNSLSNDRVLSSFEDRSGILWIGTMGGGLNRYDRKAGVITRFGKNEGIPDNVIYDILEDKHGFLWLTSNKGIIRFNPKTNTFVDYDINDGVQSHEFNLGASYMIPDGRIAMGGMNGFNLFDPTSIKTNSQIPKVVITGFEIFNQPYGRYISDGDTIILEPNNNFFSISFSALDFINPSKNQYSFMLKNYDKDWIRTDATKRKAEYTDVKPGTYVFQVKASNSDGVWNEKGVSFVIIVKPPFYQTWFFRILLIAVIIFITWLFIRGRVSKVRKQNEVETKMLRIEKQMFDLEQKALRLQMNPHFIFNSLNSIQSFVISNDTERAINYLAKFSQLMRLILTTSRESYIPLTQEVNLLKYYIDLENMRFNNRFDYEIRLDSNIDSEFTGIPPMIIQPYVENAILHGLMNKKEGGCRLLIQMWQKEDYILCVVEDNGIGREKALRIKEQSGLSQKSQGIIITKERLDILNSQLKNKISVEITDLVDSEGKASGTRVRLVIPVTEM